MGVRVEQVPKDHPDFSPEVLGYDEIGIITDNKLN
jgi:hypothetical protein